MNRIFFLVFLVLSCSLVIVAQSPDSTQAKKDSVIRIIPIPELGSLEPFRDTTLFISQKQITFSEYRSLYDIISQKPGVFVRDLASAGQQNQVIIHGIDDKNIAVMVDGIPYNDHYTSSYNLWNIPVDAIERVEFITGSEAIFYDGRSAGGVINIVTKNFNNNRASTHLRYSQGVSGYTHTDAMFAQNILSGVNLSFALAHYGFGSNKESQSYFARFYNSNDDAWLIRSKLRYNTTSWMNVTFAYSFDRKWTGLHGGVDYFNTFSIFDGLNANVQNRESFEKQFNSHYNLTASFFPFEDSTLLTSLSLYAFDRLREYRDEENRSVTLNGIYTKRDFASTGKGLKLNFLSQHSDLRFLGYADLARIQSNDIITAAIKADILPHSFFTLSPFVTVKDYGNHFTANGGVKGKFTLNSSLMVYGGIARNIINDQTIYAAPTITPLTFSASARNLQSKESISSIESGARFEINSHILLNGSYVHIVDNFPMVLDTNSSINSFTISNYFHPSSYTYDALSLHLHLLWNEYHLEAAGNYLKQPTINRYGSVSIPLKLYPDITAHGSIYYQGFLANGHLDIKFGLRWNYYSEQTGMRPYDEFGIWIPSSELTYGPSGSMDFFAVGKIGDAYVHFIWENLTGSEYLLAPVYPMYNRNIRFGLSWEFVD